MNTSKYKLVSCNADKIIPILFFNKNPANGWYCLRAMMGAYDVSALLGFDEAIAQCSNKGDLPLRSQTNTTLGLMVRYILKEETDRVRRVMALSQPTHNFFWSTWTCS